MLTTALKFFAVIVAAIILGSSFRKKDRQVHRQGGPWYQPYLSLPGFFILLVLLLPVVVWLIRRYG